MAITPQMAGLWPRANFPTSHSAITPGTARAPAASHAPSASSAQTKPNAEAMPISTGHRQIGRHPDPGGLMSPPLGRSRAARAASATTGTGAGEQHDHGEIQQEPGDLQPQAAVVPKCSGWDSSSVFKYQGMSGVAINSPECAFTTAGLIKREVTGVLPLKNTR